jgi:hypothetical protein
MTALLAGPANWKQVKIENQIGWGIKKEPDNPVLFYFAASAD